MAIEKTDKKFKLLMAVGVALISAGWLWTVAAWRREGDFEVGGAALIAAGICFILVGKLGAWWCNG